MIEIFIPRKIKMDALLKFMSLFIIISSFSIRSSNAQEKVFANTTGIQSHVDAASNATSSDVNTFATINSYGGVIAGAFSYNGELELKFDSELPAGTTSFIRIGFKGDVLDALLGGNIGKLLATTLGNVVIGDHYFEVGARDKNGKGVLGAFSNNSFTSSKIRVVQDGNGYYYIAITPDSAYDRVYIKDITKALLLGATNSTNVYYAFYTKGIEECGTPLATGYEAEGLTLDLLGLGKAGVTNAKNAIDANLNNYSELSLGLLGVAGSISQNFYFNTDSKIDDDFNLRIKASESLLKAGVLQNIRVTAYKSDAPVFSASASQLLDLDLLGLLQSGNVVSIPFSPGKAFDRVKVTLSSLLNVNLTQTIYIYGLTKSSGRPTFESPLSNAVFSCYNTETGLRATTNSSNKLVWYDSLTATSSLAETNYNEAFTAPALTANKVYYVASKRAGCTEESGRVPINITVAPLISFSATALNNASKGFFYNKQINAATGGNSNFRYELNSGSSLPDGLSLSANGTLSGTPSSTGDFTFNISAIDSKECRVNTAFKLTVDPQLSLLTSTLANGITGLNYPVQNILAATGGTGPYTYVVSGLPNGLNFEPTNLQITGVPTLKGTYTVPVKVSDANGNSVTVNYSIKIVDPLLLPPATLANGTIGLSYTKQTIPSAIGGTLPYTYKITGLAKGLDFNALSREITGVPEVSGVFPVVVNVNDDGGQTASNIYNIKINVPLVLPNKTLPDATVSVNYPALTLPSAQGGVSPYLYTLTGLPNGMTFNSLTLQIGGVPAQAGIYNLLLKVTDGDNNVASNYYVLNVLGALSLPTKTLPDGVIGTPYANQTLPAVVGGTAPYTYSLTGLPNGLIFNVTTREISGTPTMGGTYSLTMLATDGNNNTVSANYLLNIAVPKPVIDNISVCMGKTASLSVLNVQNNVTYNWYATTGNTPIATNSTGIFVTPVLNSETVFYVEAVSGTAVSARVPVTVSVNTAANPANITTNSVSINVGQSAVLTATADLGNTIKWYDKATAGTELGTGNSFSTPVLNSTTTYYVETINGLGCASLNRIPVTVTVIPNSGGVDCNKPNKQYSGISGICILCGITASGNSVDADLNNFTRITLAVGVAATGYQQLLFQSPATAADSVKLSLGLPSGLADLSVLSNIVVSFMNGNNTVKSYSLNPALLHLTLLGGNRFEVTLAGTAVFDRVEVRFGGLASLISSLDIYGAELVYPSPTVSASSLNICANTSTTINLTPAAGTTLKWYNASTNGTLLISGNSFTTPVLNATTTYYVEVSRGSCTNSSRFPVVVKVNAPISVPVTPPNLNICSGSTATLAVQNADGAVTYKWYNVANGGTALYTGSVFISPVLLNNITYYVEASQGGCINGTRASVQVVVNLKPLIPTVNASATVINPGQSSILTASSSESGVVFNWYDSANSSTPLYTGETFVTPPLTSNITYYVESKSTASNCTSSNRFPITISVNNSGNPIPVPCEAAITQTNDVEGLALLAGVFNPDLAVDNDTETGSSLVMPVGLLNASVYQRLNFGSVSNPGDTIKVLLASPAKLLSLSLLGNISVSSSLAGNNNNDAVLLNNVPLYVELLNGGAQALVTFSPSQNFDAVDIHLNSGVLGALTSINVNYAHRILKTAEVVADQVTVCNNQTAELEVKSPKPGLTYQWYNSNGDYITGKDGIKFTTPAITADTKYFVAAVSANNCIGTKVAIAVKVKDLPVIPVLVSDNITACLASNVVLAVKDPIAGVTYKWYDNSNDQFLADGNTYTVYNNITSSSYYVKADNGCSTLSDKATATITIGATVDVPVLSAASLHVTAGVPFVLTASSNIENATINWYDKPVAGILLATGNTYTVPSITQTTVFYAESIGTCGVSARASITITVDNEIPGNAPCGYATKDLESGADPIGLPLLAQVYNKDKAVDGLANTGSTLFMPVGLNASVYHRIGFESLSNIGDVLKVKISFPGKLLSLSLLGKISLQTYNDANPNGDLMIVDQSLLNIELLSGGESAILSFVPTKQFNAVELRLNSGLVGALNSVVFNYAQRIIPLPKVDQASVSYCQGGTAELKIKDAQQNITYKWYLGSTYQTGKDGTSFITDPALAVGSHDYFVTATANGCETQPTKITVVVLSKPGVPVAAVGNPTSTCLNTPVTLSVVNDAGVIYNWYNASSGGNILASNNSNYTIPANLPANTYDFYVEAVNQNGCLTPSRTKISLIIKDNATENDIDVVGNLIICASGQINLTASASSVVNPKFIWYSDAALTKIVGTSAVFSTSVSESTKFYVTVTGDNKCSNLQGSAKEVSVIVNPVAQANEITVSGNTSICSGEGISLTANSTVINPVYTWYRDADLNDKLFSGANLNLTSLSASAIYYVTVKGDNRCENNKASAKAVSVTVKPQSTANDFVVGGQTTVCKGSGTVLTASATTVINPIFTWYSSLNPRKVAFIGDTYNLNNINASTTFYVTVKGDNYCENTDDNVKTIVVTAKEYATAADIVLNNAQICSGGSVSLMASSISVAQPVFTWYSDASLTIPVYTGPTYNLTGITSQTFFYVTVKGSDKCENTAANAKMVTVNVNELANPSDIMITGNNTVCSGFSTSLVASAQGIVNPIFTWYADVAQTNIAYVGANFVTPNLNLTTTYYLTVKGDNKCENGKGNAKQFVVNVNQTPTMPIVPNTNTNICSGSSTILNVQNAVVGIAYEWYTLPSGGSILSSGPSYDTGILNSNTDYYVQAVSTTGCVNTGGRFKVTVVVNAKPLNPLVSAAALNACIGSTATLSVSNPVAGLVYNWYSSLTSSSVVGNGPIFITPKITTSIAYYVEAVSGSCSSAGRTMVSITANQVPLAPSTVNVVPSLICNGSSAALAVNNPDASLIYRWYAASTGGTYLAEGDKFTTPNLLATTSYYVESISKSEGCISISRTEVVVPVTAVLTKPVLSVKSTEINSITFSWQPVNNAKGYEVSFDNGLTWNAPSSGPLGTTTTVLGLQPDQSVVIIVRALGQTSCQTSLNSDPITGISSNPLKNEVYIPNAFTPNNDGKNDVFLVYGTTIKSVVMKIYNQWGQLILSSDSVNQGWDGTYKGVAQPTGVYVYLIDVESKDGTKSTKKGTVTLIR